MPIDAIVVGAGIWGCTVARRLAEAGRKVLVLEKRPVVNAMCAANASMGRHGMKNYCGNLLWQSCLTLLFPNNEVALTYSTTRV